MKRLLVIVIVILSTTTCFFKNSYSKIGITDILALLDRLKNSYALDPTFGSNGKVITPIGSGDDYAYAVAIQSDRKIVVAGYSNNGSNNDFTVVRYNTNGSLDTSFGGTGIVTTDISGDDQAYAVAIQSNGKIVVAGFTKTNQNAPGDFAVVRYLPDGSPDPDFGTNGIVTTNISGSSSSSSNSDDKARAVAIQPDGKILVAGYSYNGSSNYNFAVVRYNPNGSVDSDQDQYDGNNSYFDPNQKDGIVTTDISGDDQAQAVAIQNVNGVEKIVVAGYSYNGSNYYDFAVVRYDTYGSLDTSFGSGGKVTTPIGSSDQAYAVAIQSDGKIVVAGTSNYDFAVVRYNTNGSLDTSFDPVDHDGKVTTNIGKGFSSMDEAYAVAIQPDGKIVVAGFTQKGGYTPRDFAVVRYNSDGSPYTTFNSVRQDGIVTTDFIGGDDGAYAVAIQPDRKIVVAGFSWNGSSNRDFAVVRYR